MPSAVETVAALSADWNALFDAAPVQSTRAWWHATEVAALPRGTGPLYVQHTQNGLPAALIPLAITARQANSLTTPYTVLYQPLLTPGADPARAGQALAAHIRTSCSLDAIDPAWPALPRFLAGLRGCGVRARQYRHFGNWYLDVAAMDWPAYLASRGGRLRETIRRRGAAAARDPAIRVTYVQDGADVLPALQAYETVYARSWKVPEPYPAFNPALLPGLAAAGCLRMAVMWEHDRPIAAQYWTVRHGVATLLKLAHDEADRARSPGTVLTAWMIRRLMEQDATTVLDFGRGDDPYKREWVDDRRDRIGLLLARPGTARGAAALLRHDLGVARRRLLGGVASDPM